MNHLYTGLFKLTPNHNSSIDGFVVHDKTTVKTSIMTLLKTHKGSRVYDPNFGTNLHKLIHEQNIQRIRNIVVNEIKSALNKYEPRVEVIKIMALPSRGSKEKVIVYMTLLFIEFDDEEIMEFSLDSDMTWINSDMKDYDALKP